MIEDSFSVIKTAVMMRISVLTVLVLKRSLGLISPCLKRPSQSTVELTTGDEAPLIFYPSSLHYVG
jgi:hypothetical protein